MIANCENYRLADAAALHKSLDAKQSFKLKESLGALGHDSDSSQEQGQLSASAADLNDVIQNQLQPLLEGVNLNGASINDLHQLAAQLKQQQQLAAAAAAATTVVVAHSSSNGSSASTSPLLKSSESSLSPAPQSTSQQASSALASSSGSYSNNWSTQQSQQQQQQSALGNEAGAGNQSNVLDNMSSAAAAAWTSALYAAVASASQQPQQQYSPNLINQLQQSNMSGFGPAASASSSSGLQKGPASNGASKIVNGASMNSSGQHKQQPSQAAVLASLLKANIIPADQQLSLLNSLNSLHPQTKNNSSAALAALADSNAKTSSGNQQRSFLSNGNSNAVQPTRSCFTEDSEERSELDMYMFNSHLIELIKNYPNQLEQFLKLRNMMQSEDGNSGASSTNSPLVDDFQQQLDQMVPANLAAAIAASANNRLNLNAGLSQANFNRSSPKAAMNLQKLQQHQNAGMMGNGVNGNSGHMMMNNNHGQSGAQKFQMPQPYTQNFLNKSLQQHQYNQFQDCQEERFSRKVFVGGLPPDIDEDEIVTHFRRYGNLIVDWPHKAESKSYFPPKGYAFLIFQEERNVQDLIETCVMDDGKLYTVVSSPSMKDKPVQIRPWCLADSDFVMDGSQPLDPQKTIFVGGVPRPIKAIELAMIMDRLYGGVCYAGIDTDPKLKYPKGAGRVAFSNQQSYIAAISARFVQLHHGEIDKRVEVKPYVLDDQMCDECQGTLCGGKFAPFFCANITCLQYYCEQCWTTIHSRPGREYHKPLVKEGADRPRRMPYSKS